MITRDVAFSFEVVSFEEADRAFAFHLRIAHGNEHIWPRTQEQIQAYAGEQQLYGVRRLDTGDYVGLCYATLHNDEWEIGGLTVDEAAQNLGIGTLLVRLTLAHTLLVHDPMKYGQRVIAHVHEANQDPRNLLARLGFDRYDRVRVPGKDAPASMRRDTEGYVVGDKYRLTREGLLNLSLWLDNDFHNTVGRSDNRIALDLGVYTLEDLRNAVRAMARQLCSSS